MRSRRYARSNYSNSWDGRASRQSQSPTNNSSMFSLRGSRRSNNHGGVLSVMERLNDATVRNQADLVTTACDLSGQMRRLEERLSSKIDEMAVRQEAVEILFEQQEKDLDYMKDLMKFQLDCLISLYRGLVAGITNAGVPSTLSPNTAQQVMVPEPEQEQPAQDPSSLIQETSVGSSEATAQDSNYEPPNVKFIPTARFTCEHCNRSYTSQRNLDLHMDRMPKFCVLKRTRALRASRGRARKSRGFYQVY